MGEVGDNTPKASSMIQSSLVADPHSVMVSGRLSGQLADPKGGSLGGQSGPGCGQTVRWAAPSSFGCLSGQELLGPTQRALASITDIKFPGVSWVFVGLGGSLLRLAAQWAALPSSGTSEGLAQHCWEGSPVPVLIWWSYALCL